MNARAEWLIVPLVLVSAVAGGRILRAVVDLSQDEKHALLSADAKIPDLTVMGPQGPTSLLAALDGVDANALVLLSTQCTTALGELAGWRDAVGRSDGVRPFVIVADAEPGYATQMSRLLGDLGFEIYTLSSEELPTLGAEAVPVVYSLSDDRRVSEGAIGIRGVLEIRDRLVSGGLR